MRCLNCGNEMERQGERTSKSYEYDWCSSCNLQIVRAERSVVWDSKIKRPPMEGWMSVGMKEPKGSLRKHRSQKAGS